MRNSVTQQLLVALVLLQIDLLILLLEVVTQYCSFHPSQTFGYFVRKCRRTPASCLTNCFPLTFQRQIVSVPTDYHVSSLQSMI